MQLADVWRCSIAYALHEPATSLRGSHLTMLGKNEPNHPGRVATRAALVILPDRAASVNHRLDGDNHGAAVLGVRSTSYTVRSTEYTEDLPDTRTARACQSIRPGVYIHTCNLYL